MSTLWFARRAGFVFSVENCESWHQRISGLLTRNGIKNVNYAFATSRADYIVGGSAAGTDYDLVMVDGDFRSDCVRHAVDRLRKAGILYLDNSDKDSGPAGGDVRLAEELALDFARRMKATIQYFTDFAPAQLTPNQGLMISLPRH
jgi:predicted O-methyltransferase YrrM